MIQPAAPAVAPRRARQPINIRKDRTIKPTRKQNLLVSILAAGVLSACGKMADVPTSAVSITNQPAPMAATTPAFAKLTGKWLRPDGGYILEIRSVESTGKMDASYLNPRPINVAKAEASQKGGTVKVFIELRDVNYPGSTYTLSYNPTTDHFNGIYYQPALQQSFDVQFIRLKQ